MPTWREKATPIIARVIRENAGRDSIEIRAALREAYPFGARELHPYKIWCDEINVQMGTKREKKKVEQIESAEIKVLPLFDIEQKDGGIE